MAPHTLCRDTYHCKHPRGILPSVLTRSCLWLDFFLFFSFFPLCLWDHDAEEGDFLWRVWLLSSHAWYSQQEASC